MSLQLRLPLRLPEDHYDLVSPHQERNLIAYTPKMPKAWHVLNREVARDTLSKWLDQPDIFVTPNEFYNWRLIKNTAALNAMYVDIDAHQGEDIMRAVALAMSEIESAGIPEPNCIIYTGRGAHLYWLLQRTPTSALPRWQACQRRLVALCKGDRMSADATRVLRVVGTVNSKADNYKVTAEPIHPLRYEFDWLADQILPHTRGEIRDIRAARAARQMNDIKRRAEPTKQHGSIYERWYLVYRDLHAIVEFNWADTGVQPGHRDTLLFHMANALSWFTLSDSLENEIEAVARQLMPSLTSKEAQSYCGSVLRRARETSTTGIEKRYRYRRETLFAELEPLIPAELLPRLRAIIPNELAADRKRATNRKSDTKRRAASGTIPRSDYLATADNRKTTARELRAQNMSIRAIATQMGLSVGAISGYLRETDACSKFACLV